MNYEIEEFCCENCLAGNVINAIYEMSELKGDEYSSATILCKQDLAEKLLKVFTGEGVNGFSFDIEYINFDKANYNKEYGVTIDTDGILSIDKAYFDDGELLTFGEDFVYISDEVNSKLFINQVGYDEDAVTTFSLLENDSDEDFEDLDDECDGDCENCELNGEEFADDESVDLYDVVESMVDAILEEKFRRK